MSILLFIVGALALMAGVAMAGFGIPINEFSFGNTLIVAGATVATGGLIIIGLGAVVSHLKRVTEALNAQAANGPAGAPDQFELPPRAAPVGARVPFPPRSKPAPAIHEDEPAVPRAAAPEIAPDDRREFAVAPVLANPDVPPMAPKEAAPLPPPRPLSPPPPADFAPPPRPLAPAEPIEPLLRQVSPPPPSEPLQKRDRPAFDAMWPADKPSPARPPFAIAPKPEARFDGPAREDRIAPPPADIPRPPARNGGDAPRAVAILKSGVVDGMSYTLYVDGSIEAELPQGTLRFASINELRGYLEKNA